MQIKNLLKEPLLHFMIAGALLFLVFSIFSSPEDEKTILIDEFDLAEIIYKWESQYNRSPNLEELKGLLDEYIKEEIYYREALSLNLDHNDAIVRRRLAQKMTFLAEGVATMQEPTDEELQAFLEANQSEYRTSPTYSFEQRFYSPDNRTNPLEDAKRALETGDYTTSDKLSLPKEFSGWDLDRVRRSFGTTFAVNLSKLNVATNWQGPIESGFGYHLVLVNSREDAQNQTLDEVREAVLTSYKFEMREQLNLQVQSAILDDYEIIIDLDTAGLDEYELKR